MRITTLRNAAILFALVAGFAFLTPPASAQTYGRGGAVRTGEPTDPDDALQLLDQADVQLSDYGLDTQAPESETETQTWFEQLLALLRSLGLIADSGND